MKKFEETFTFFYNVEFKINVNILCSYKEIIDILRKEKFYSAKLIT